MYGLIMTEFTPVVPEILPFEYRDHRVAKGRADPVGESSRLVNKNYPLRSDRK